MTGGLGVAGRIARAFVDSKLTQLAMVGALFLGAFAVLATPREEEPQIIVPFADIFVEMPGAGVREVEERVAIPLEKKLREIPGVEYVYSISRPGSTVAIIRFHVGQNLEDSLVKLYNKLHSNFDLIPAGASQPLVKPRSIDDVPVLALTLWGPAADGFALRRIAAQLDEEIKAIPDVSETRLIGGLRRQLRVTLNRDRMAGYGVDAGAVLAALGESNRQLRAGSFARDNREYVVDAGAFLDRAVEVGAAVVGVAGGRPVYLRDVAAVDDGPEEPPDYVLMSPAGRGRDGGETVPAVTLTVAKRQGTNAVVIAEQVLARLHEVRGAIIPGDVEVTVTRNYGETAREKSDELLKHLLLATLSVTVLIAFFLGIRAALVVLVAVPVTLCLTLFLYYLYGYTLNRVTLFALIFSIGILVDDAIVVVENIARHFQLPEAQGRPRMQVAVEAVDEVGNPTILATFAVIAAILPMAFVGGLMGPYMRPIPVGASVAMLFSLFIAFIISPWAAARLLRPGAGEPREGGDREDRMTRLYRRLMFPLLEDWKRRTVFLCALVVLLVAACSLVLLKVVRAKMLPFDNKSELQVIVDMPEGTTLEDTARVTRELAQSLASVPEVRDLQLYVGTAAPYNFNGLIRHYFPPMRQGPNVADIQVNLLPKGERRAQSHDIARRLRPGLQEIAWRSGARIKVAEVPPGPPVLQTLVAEIYAPDPLLQMEVSRRVLSIFARTPGVVDVDWYVEAPQPGFRFALDKEKAALYGISTEQMVQALRVALAGASPGLFHLVTEKEDVPIVVRLPRSQRSGVEALRDLKLRGRSGVLAPLSELARVEPTVQPPFVYRKNLQRVVYVTGDVAGREESPVYAILTMNEALGALRLPDGQPVPVHLSGQPVPSRGAAVKWDGEWQVTYEVFRDLGAAFAAVMVLIYILVVAWFRSFRTPLVIMAPIPLTLVGILPAHFLMGAFFTATSMIGFIAGAGIIVRNSIILVDFIELRRSQGMALAAAVVEAGAVRFRPMLLTASAVVVGASVMLFDPIFQGLAISLMAGEVASTLLSRMAVPVLYFLAQRGREP
ncbi:MAG: efflux RND transporter permease subunit [Candidatus Rokubacteria bacterium]|nr:efflux RND transporter permease subunit [Candidatus Rokubacteria bacterium]